MRAAVPNSGYEFSDFQNRCRILLDLTISKHEFLRVRSRTKKTTLTKKFYIQILLLIKWGLSQRIGMCQTESVQPRLMDNLGTGGQACWAW